MILLHGSLCFNEDRWRLLRTVGNTLAHRRQTVEVLLSFIHFMIEIPALNPGASESMNLRLNGYYSSYYHHKRHDVIYC